MKKTPFIIGGIAVTSAFFIKLFYAIVIFLILLFITRQVSLFIRKRKNKDSLWNNEEDNYLW